MDLKLWGWNLSSFEEKQKDSLLILRCDSSELCWTLNCWVVSWNLARGLGLCFLKQCAEDSEGKGQETARNIHIKCWLYWDEEQRPCKKGTDRSCPRIWKKNAKRRGEQEAMNSTWRTEHLFITGRLCPLLSRSLHSWPLFSPPFTLACYCLKCPIWSGRHGEETWIGTGGPGSNLAASGSFLGWVVQRNGMKPTLLPGQLIFQS